MAFIKLPPKDPRECLDYTIDFRDLIPEGNQLTSAEAVIESVSPAEPSPNTETELDITQQSPQATVVSSGATSPARNDQVVVWLEQGRLNATYTIRVDAFDDFATPAPRKFTRRATIKISRK